MSREQSNDQGFRQSPAADELPPAVKDLRPLFDAIDGRLAGIESSLKRRAAPTEDGPSRRQAGGRGALIAWSAAAGIAAVTLALVVSLGLAVVQLRRAAVDGLGDEARDLKQTLKFVLAEIDELKRARRDLDGVVSRAEGARSTFDGAARNLDSAIGQVGELGGKIAAIEDQVDSNTKALEVRLNGLGSALAAQLGKYIEGAYSQPVQDMRATVADLIDQVSVFNDRTRRPARSERTAVVVFDSASQRSEASRDALRRLFCRTAIRSGFDGYQLALYQASGGRLTLPPRLPFGEEPAPAQPFSEEWTTLEGAMERAQDLDPSPIFAGVPTGMSRRVVLVVGGQAEPPAADSKSWPDDLKVHAIVVGSRDPRRLDAWRRFCEKRGGQARAVENASDPLLAELKELAQPTLPQGPK